MKIKMFKKLQKLYYKTKYSNLKSGSGAVGVIIGSKKNKKDDFNAKLEEIASRTSPCYKTNDEVLAYIRERYDLKSTIPTEAEKTQFKINYILNKRPDVLTTPEIKLSENGKTPNRNEFEKFQENQHDRFAEARLYPFENLGLDISTYSFGVDIAGGVALFKVVCENNKDELYITATTNFHPQEKDSEHIRRISDEITVFRGIKQEDIDERTRNFIVYAAALINLEKLKGAVE